MLHRLSRQEVYANRSFCSSLCMNMTTVAQPETIRDVGQVLRDRSKPLKDRFRALFTLRNLGGKDAIDHISSCFDDESALLKHELAYCLGQMQDEYAIPSLVTVLKDTNQEAMVRHEAGKYSTTRPLRLVDFILC